MMRPPSISLVFDVGREPSSPFCFLKGIASLAEKARDAGSTVQLIGIVPDSSLEPTRNALSRLSIADCRLVQTGTAGSEDALLGVLDGVTDSHVAVVAAGMLVSPDWLARAAASWADGQVLHPSVGVLCDAVEAGWVDHAARAPAEGLIPALLDGDCYPPVAFGSRPQLASEARAGSLSILPFTARAGFVALNSGSRRARMYVPESMYFHSTGLAELRRSGRVGPAPYARAPDWLAGRFREFKALDPRADFGDDSEPFRKHLQFVDRVAPDKLRNLYSLFNEVRAGERIFVCSDFGGWVWAELAFHLVESLDRADERTWVVCRTHDALPERVTTDPRFRFISIKYCTFADDLEVEALALAAALASTPAESLHFFDSPLSRDMMKSYLDRVIPDQRMTYTLFPLHLGQCSGLHRILTGDRLQKFGKVRLLSFDEDRPSFRLAQSYLSEPPVLLSRWQPGEWRRSVLGGTAGI